MALELNLWLMRCNDDVVSNIQNVLFGQMHYRHISVRIVVCQYCILVRLDGLNQLCYAAAEGT